MKSVSTLLSATAVASALLFSNALAADTIKIGVAGPYTGANATFGEQVFSGVSAYVTDVNASGGINGKKIELVKGDDACEPKQAVSVANRFVDQDKVQAVIGHFCSSNTIPASEIYNDAGILEMTPSSTNPTVTDRGFDNLFRGCGRDDQQAVVAGAFILDTLKRDKIALIHDKDTYGQGLVDAVKKTIEARGIKPVMYEGLTRGERDFNALVTKIKSSGANAVYFGGLIPEGGPLIRQLKEQGVDVVVVSGDAFAQTELVAAAGGAQNLKNVYYSATPDPLADPSTQGVQDSLKKANITPANYVLYGYANAQAVIAALKAGDELKAQADYLRSNTVDSAIGKITWDAKGDIKDFKFVFYNFDDKGTPVLVK
ncbi:ABC transporter substrate-binding protein [Rhizobium sp. 1AS11]|uniref:ABC transporter substrate-binding protein n=1 Tax=Rhizobium acaciae TaxID=2989736 RepID=UPI00221E6BF6|nr:ABC transporter substrate-binding protein [Rhizobium acaciae]MCW1409853.1 ABC transporter substrate-binding protein [Rhizobium acaciae]MCW1741895.1 ABC transporter substrate-binding protein [Rhizobium acaciae]MCW1750938.1 ABC transporter substrate-binding protein [Rhizobium acaciae]